MTTPSRAFTFTVFGRPAQQGSKNNYGKGHTVEAASKKLVPWREAVKHAARLEIEKGGEPWWPFEGPLACDVTFWVPRPTTRPKKYWAPDKAPDLDKYCRGVLDAITDANVWHVDSQVVTLTARKRYAVEHPPGATVVIFEVSDA